MPALEDVQALIDAAPSGLITIPPGVYTGDGDLVIADRNSDGAGSTTIEASGVILPGTGRLIIRRCKRLSIRRLRAQAFDMVWRGCWWGEFAACDLRSLVVGGGDEGWNSCYWNNFYGGLMQGVTFHSSMTEGANVTRFHGTSFRGNAGQGFASSRPVAFEFNGNQDVQALSFMGGDVSYYGDIYSISYANTSGDIECDFNGVYFDNVAPRPLDNGSNRTVTISGHVAGKMMYAAPVSAAVRGEVALWGSAHTAGWAPYGGFNFIPNGAFAVDHPSFVGVGQPITSLGGAVLTKKSGGVGGRHITLTQSASGTVRFRCPSAPMAGIYTATLVMRSSAGNQSVKVSTGGQYFVVDLTPQWHVFQAAGNGNCAEGAVNDITLSTQDGAPFTIDICYVGLRLGKSGPIFLPQPS